MRKIKGLLIIGVAAAIYFMASGAQAATTFVSNGNPDDTLAGTVITSLATLETIDYTDANSNPMPTVNPPSNINVTVLPVYGFSGVNALADVNIIVSQMVTHEYFVTNEGNASDTYVLSFAANYAGNASGKTWVVNVKRKGDGVQLGSLTGASSTTNYSTAVVVAEDADFNFIIEVTASNECLKGDYVDLTSTSTTGATPVGQYQGANGLYYAGTKEATDTLRDMIVKPIMVITRVASVDAPDASQSTGGGGYLQGTPRDPVPGAIWTFTMRYTNEGNSTAESVVICDRVPSSAEADGATNIAHVNKTGATTYVTLTPSPGDGDGWTVYGTTEANPIKTHGAAGWTQLVVLTDGDEIYPSGTLTVYHADTNFPLKWIKWDKQSPGVASGETGTLQWGVTIR